MGSVEWKWGFGTGDVEEQKGVKDGGDIMGGETKVGCRHVEYLRQQQWAFNELFGTGDGEEQQGVKGEVEGNSMGGLTEVGGQAEYLRQQQWAFHDHIECAIRVARLTLQDSVYTIINEEAPEVSWQLVGTRIEHTLKPIERYMDGTSRGAKPITDAKMKFASDISLAISAATAAFPDATVQYKHNRSLPQ